MRRAASLTFLLYLVTRSAAECVCGSPDSDRCEAGWEFFQDNCYYFSTVAESAKTAQDMCHSMGAHLVDIRSAEENAFLLGDDAGIRPWIGLNWREEGWYWNNDRSQAAYQRWNLGEPNSDENCAEMDYTSGYWSSRKCSHSRWYICKLVRTGDVCASGWHQFRAHCYKFSDESLVWTQAQQQCESMGARLADIRNDQENEFIKGKISQWSWIGLQRRTGAWVWNNDVDQQADYTPWNTGEPNNANGEEFCVLQRSDGRWNDADCDDDATRYICKTSAAPPRDDSEDCVIEEGEGFPFGPCSVTCGEGTKARVYYCTVKATGVERFVREVVPCTVSCDE